MNNYSISHYCSSRH